MSELMAVERFCKELLEGYAILGELHRMVLGGD